MRLFLFVVAIILICHSYANGKLVAYKFSGSYEVEDSLPYDLPLPDSGTVVGRFVYDTDSAPTFTIPGCDCTAYRQFIPDGISVSFNDVVVRADQYDAEVLNDSNPSKMHPTDAFNVIYSSAAISPVSPPLLVNGTARSQGYLSFSSVDLSASMLLDSKLPPDLSVSDDLFRSGSFSDDPYKFEVSFSIDTFSPVEPLPGDYNLDGVVDASDYIAWKTSFGTAANSLADGDHDGVVDAADYTVWRDHLGTHADALAAAATTGVPEPATFSLFAAGILSLLAWVRPCTLGPTGWTR